MKDFKYYESLGVFDEYQLGQIKIGLDRGLDVSVYAKPEYTVTQMRLARLRLEGALDDSDVIL